MERNKHERKKRYGWLVTFAAVNWLAIALVIWKVDPETVKDFIVPGSYFPMLMLMAGGFFWLLSILFLSSSMAFRWTFGLTAFLLLRVLKLGTLMNGLLILGLLVSLEVYIYRKNPKKRDVNVTEVSGTASARIRDSQ
jgi:hypothetical protein